MEYIYEFDQKYENSLLEYVRHKSPEEFDMPEEWYDALRESLEANYPDIIMVDPNEAQKMNWCYSVLRDITSGTDVKITTYSHDYLTGPLDGIEITGKVISFREPFLLHDVIKTASTFDADTKVNGDVCINLSFRGLRKGFKVE